MIQDKKWITIFDLGSHTVKLLVLDSTTTKPTIVKLKSVPLPKDKPAEEALETVVLDLLGDLTSQEKSNISVILPNYAVFSRYVTLPNISPSKIKQIIRFEAEQQIPFVLKEVTWDYAVIAETPTRDVNIVISAIRNAKINQVAPYFKGLKTPVQTFGLTQLSLMNLAGFCKLPEKNYMIIDLGHQITNIIVLEGYKGWARNLPFGGGRLNLTEGEKLDRESEGFKKFLAQLLNEIKITLSFYTSFSREIHLEKIYLTGGLSYLPNITSLFETELNRKAEILDCTPYFNVANNLKSTFEEQGSFYHATLGLAISKLSKHSLNVNLLPGNEKAKREIKKTRRKIFGITSISLLFFVALFFNTFYQMNLKKEKIKAAEEKLEYYKQFAYHIDKIEKDLHIFDSKLSMIREKNTKRYIFYQALEKIQKALPKNIWFQTIRLEKDNGIILEGICEGTLAEINLYKNSLQKETLFTDITIDEANIADNETGNRFFTLRLYLSEDIPYA